MDALPLPVVRRRPLLQRTLFCPCGQALPAIAGLCRSCYSAQRNSRARFGGHRERVLARDDRRCRACGAGKPGRRLHVHHRQPGFHQPERLVTVCAACHARIHRLRALRAWLPDPLVGLWAEQHPGVPLQLQFFFALPGAEEQRRAA